VRTPLETENRLEGNRMSQATWPVGDPQFEPLFRDLIAIVCDIIVFYDIQVDRGIAKLEDIANEGRR
jgi:hypothetical protein